MSEPSEFAMELATKTDRTNIECGAHIIDAAIAKRDDEMFKRLAAYLANEAWSADEALVAHAIEGFRELESSAAGG